VFEDVVGPPDYKIAADAAITVVIASGAKVRSTFAFTDGSPGTRELDDIVKAWKATLAPGAPK